jgi:hypothetical protein
MHNVIIRGIAGIYYIEKKMTIILKENFIPKVTIILGWREYYYLALIC